MAMMMVGETGAGKERGARTDAHIQRELYYLTISDNAHKFHLLQL